MNKIVYLGLLICLEVILTRFLSIQTPIIRVGFGFLPIAAAGILLGQLWAGMAAAIADILGMLIFPKGAYFPGFNASVFYTPLIFNRLTYINWEGVFNMRVNKLIATDKHYEHRGEIEFKPKKENSNNGSISFSEILSKNMKKIQSKISTQ